MQLTLTISDPESIIPDAHVAAEAAVRGMEVLVIDHLRDKNNRSAHKSGFPKSDYYAKAANNVAASVAGNVARIEIDHPGLALHYEGGTVWPKKKALAIPIDPSVAAIWPSEAGGIATGGSEEIRGEFREQDLEPFAYGSGLRWLVRIVQKELQNQ